MAQEIDVIRENFIEIRYNFNGHTVTDLLVFNSVADANAAIPQDARRLGYPILILLPVPVLYGYIGNTQNADLKPIQGFLETVLFVQSEVGAVTSTLIRDEGNGITGLTRVGVGAYDFAGTFTLDNNTFVTVTGNNGSVYFRGVVGSDLLVQMLTTDTLEMLASDLGFEDGAFISIKQYL
jgi:hypothetical protein